MGVCIENNQTCIPLINKKVKDTFAKNSNTILGYLKSKHESGHNFMYQTICFLLMLFPAKNITTEDIFRTQLSPKIISVLMRLGIASDGNNIAIPFGWAYCFILFQSFSIKKYYSSFDEVQHFGSLYRPKTTPRNIINLYLFLLLLADNDLIADGVTSIDEFLNKEIEFKEKSWIFKDFFLKYLSDLHNYTNAHVKVTDEIQTFMGKFVFSRSNKSSLKIIDSNQILRFIQNKKVKSNGTLYYSYYIIM